LTAGSSGRVKELEVGLEDARRRLAEERQMKENYEDLLTALRSELEELRNERDNLRDEIVPRLRARVEGLESETSELQKGMYENTQIQQDHTQMQEEHSKMQQELLNLRNENASLASAIQVQASAIQTSAVQKQARQSIIGRPSRPVSLMGSPISTMPLALDFKDRETLAEKVKGIEEQRDALHSALKSLQERHRYENKRAKERIKALELERDKALQQTNRRYGKDREMSTIRKEMERLRRRADEAIESKVRCEKNLGTLKMDLEQAETETATLRALLQEHDLLVGRHSELRDSYFRQSKQMSHLRQEKASEETSLSLQRAYNDLQDIHARSLARLDELEEKGNDLSEDITDREKKLSEAHSESQRAITKLMQGVAQAEAERDEAQVEAEAYRKRAESLQNSEKKHLAEERSLSIQLKISTERIGELAAQVRSQLESNNSLRDRLAEAIGRGEEDQKLSAQKINELQERLRVLEDKVLEAQQQTEEAVARHEEEVRKLKDTHTSQLRRLKTTAMGSPTGLAARSPLSPMLRSPRLEWTGFKKPSQSIPDSSRIEYLEKRVDELEKALGQADNEMAEVVGKMNTAQIEVMELQNERYYNLLQCEITRLIFI
jgi:chromosome segregation ATPase